MRTVSPATTQVDGNAVYVATASEDPVSLFITEKGDTATAISLTLAPRHIPPREVRLVLTGGAAQVANAAELARVDAREQPFRLRGARRTTSADGPTSCCSPCSPSFHSSRTITSRSTRFSASLRVLVLQLYSAIRPSFAL